MRSFSSLALLSSLCACTSEVKFGSEHDPEQPTTTDQQTSDPHTPEVETDVGDDDDDDVGDDDDDSGDDDDDDDAPDVDTGDPEQPYRPREEPPNPYGSLDCPDGVLATWLSGELVVFSDDPPVTGVLQVTDAGIYDVYDLSVAESGAGQTNESAFLRIPNSVDPVGYPATYSATNCGDDYVALDPDNLAPVPAGTSVYLGTFTLEAGDNVVELHHYCEQYFAGACHNLHDDAGTTCSGGINSVHFTGTAVCLVRVR